jgi:hypothetical protein
MHFLAQRVEVLQEEKEEVECLQERAREVEFHLLF